MLCLKSLIDNVNASEIEYDVTEDFHSQFDYDQREEENQTKKNLTPITMMVNHFTHSLPMGIQAILVYLNF